MEPKPFDFVILSKSISSESSEKVMTMAFLTLAENYGWQM